MTGHGYCECGCGLKTAIAKGTHKKYGWVKGQPVRFVRGHQSRKNGPCWIEDPDTGCRIWQRGKSGAGYSQLSVGGGNTRLAHRIFYEYIHGPQPGLVIDHLCRNPACVNIEHLEAVTHAENIRRGDNAKLTATDAEAIRASEEGAAVLAARYGVNRHYVDQIRRGTRWATA